MSPWHSALIVASALMFCTAAPSFAVPTSNGPTSVEEGNLLWKDGQDAAAEGRCADAVPELKRLVDRYPGHAGYVKAHLLLGECLIALDDAREAVAPLRYFTSGSASESTPESHELFQRGRVALGRAYLAVNRGNEAYLAASEIARHAKEPRAGQPPEATALQGLLIRARALILLGQDERALETLDSTGERIPPGQADLLAEAASTRMKLVTRRCARLPGKGTMDEAQARDELGRRGGCVLEATVLARDTLMTGQVTWAKQVEKQAVEALDSFRQACAAPPQPPKKTKRTREELRKYRLELVDVLARDCAKTYQGGLTLLDGWKDRVPAQSAPYLLGIRSAFADALGGPK